MHLRAERFPLHRPLHTQAYPAASPIRRLSQSPTDALIDLGVGGRLFCKFPVRLDLNPVIHLRITVHPQRRPACRGYVRGLRVDPDVIEDLPDLRALGNEGDQAHLPSGATAGAPSP